MNTNDSQPKMPEMIPWAGRDNTGDEASNIVGNRTGLLAIRSAIDAALENRPSSIDAPDIEFNGVQLLDQPQPEQVPFTSGKWLSAGCLLLVLVVFAIFLFGLVQIVRNLS